MSTQVKTEVEERRYHEVMARLCIERGFPELGRSHAIQARDCPRGCTCESCWRTKVEEEARKLAKTKRLLSQAVSA